MESGFTKINQFIKLDDIVLAEAFNILYCDIYHKRFTINDKARDIRSVIIGYTMPYVPFINYMLFVNFLESKVD